MDWIKWIKLIITAVIFTVIVRFFAGIPFGTVFLVITLLIAGILWSHMNKLNALRGLEEGFLLGLIIAIIFCISYALLAGWTNFIWVIQIIIIFGIPSAMGAGLYGIINARKT
jgi:hypothetical protein